MKNRKKYTEVFIIGIIIVFLVGAVSAVTTEETTINVEGFDLISWFRHTFGIQEFSIVGDYRQCNRYPFKTLEFNKGAFMSVSASSYCSSDHGLLDVFDGKWNTIGEWKDDIGLSCGDNDGCIVEIYCCPHKECFKDWECVDWYGSGSICKTKVANDPNIDYKSGSTFKYCTEPSGIQVTCWYKANGDCATRTYIGDSVCPATYMGRTLYDSRSECEGQINGNGNGNGDGPPRCIDKEGTFYTDGYATIGKGDFKFLGYESQSTSGALEVINVKDLNRVIPGITQKYFENRRTACCNGLEPVFHDEKTGTYNKVDFELTETLIPFWNYIKDKLFKEEVDWDVIDIVASYSIYRCVPEGEAGFCLEFAHRWLKPITKSDDCQTNTIILVVLIVLFFFMISRFMGCYGEINKYYLSDGKNVI